jgi:hypothetical protein
MAGQTAAAIAESRARRVDTKAATAGTRRSPARATALILGAVIVVVVALVLVLSSRGGGSSNKQGAANVSSTTSVHKHTQGASPHHGEGASVAASPAVTSVAVLNGTNTAGLAHSLSKALQRSGFKQARALNGTPPGSHATTLVEYTSGHRADAQGVASALGVGQVQPMETSVASLAGPAIVVVIAGADKTAAAGGGETSAGGSGETSAGGSGEAPAGGGASGATG